MQWSGAMLIIVLILGLLIREGSPEVIWHHPPDKVVIEGGGMLHAVLELRGEDPKSLVINVNGNPVPPTKPPLKGPEGLFVHYAFQLKGGLNTLEALWGGGKEKREAFFAEPWGEEKRPPAPFTRLLFHQVEGLEKRCRACHDLQPRPEDAAPPSPEQSTCYPCHARITAFKQVHGPAARWACTFCHNPNSTPSRYDTPRPVSELCFLCHADLKEYFYGSPYQHGPTATGRCTICHSPHATDYPFWLKRPPWYLCTSCHTEKASGRHVIAWGPSGDTHPTRGKPDPMKPDRELACNSCHNPHAAASPKLWNFSATTQTQLCQTCHQK